MAFTYSPIASFTVGAGGTSTITFLNIPQNYTDLVVKISGRVSNATNVGFTSLNLNGNTTGNVTNRYIFGDGTQALSFVLTTVTGSAGYISGNNSTSNTFGTVDYYIPNYTSSTAKSVSSDSASENNATQAKTGLVATLSPNTSPVTSFTLTCGDDGNGAAGNWMQHTTVYIYGIRATEY